MSIECAPLQPAGHLEDAFAVCEFLGPLVFTDIIIACSECLLI